MRKRMQIVGGTVMALTLGIGAGPARAGEAGAYLKGAAAKLGHGVASVLYAPADVVVTPCAFAVDRDSDGAVASSVGLSLGLPLGLLNAGYRATLGFAEVTTFLFV